MDRIISTSTGAPRIKCKGTLADIRRVLKKEGVKTQEGEAVMKTADGAFSIKFGLNIAGD